MTAERYPITTIIRGFLKGGPLYVRIRSNQLHVRDVGDGREYIDEPVLALLGNKAEVVAAGRAAVDLARRQSGIRLVNGFDHPRTIIADYTVAEKILQHAVRELYRGRWFRPAPTMVIHPLEKLEGGLTQVEKRALQELAEGAGARKAHIWYGREFMDHELQSTLPRELIAADA